MTFTVTPQPDNIPPRVRIDVNSDDSSKPFTSLTIKRDGKPLREQPFVGSSSAVLFDYEAPFGVPVSYSAIGTIANTTLILNETWSSLSGWTTADGSPSVSGSRLSNGNVTRPAAFPSAGRISCVGLTQSSGGSIRGLQFGPIRVQDTSGAGGTLWYGGGSGKNPVSGLSSPFSVIWDASTATLTTSSGVYTQERVAGGAVNDFRAYSLNSASFVDDFMAYSLVPDAFTATASTTLDVSETWLIHPSKPSLSVPIYSHGGQNGVRWIEASSGEAKSSQAVATVHRPVGRRRAVVITSGPRQADEWTLVVESETIAAKNSLRAIVDDQTPLLLRSPASVVLDLPDDWYSVGDVTTTRVEVPVITQVTTMVLPLTPVDEPVVRVGSLWTAGDVLTAYSSAQAVLDVYPTSLDLLAGPQT